MPEDWHLYARRGRVHVHRGESFRADADFAKVVSMASEEALYNWFANCAYDCRDREIWEPALVFLEKLIAKEPDEWQWHADKAEALGELGRTEQQQAAFYRALKQCDEPLVPEFVARMTSHGDWSTLRTMYSRAEKKSWLSLLDWKNYRDVPVKWATIQVMSRLWRAYNNVLAATPTRKPCWNESASTVIRAN